MATELPALVQPPEDLSLADALAYLDYATSHLLRYPPDQVIAAAHTVNPPIKVVLNTGFYTAVRSLLEDANQLDAYAAEIYKTEQAEIWAQDFGVRMPIRESDVPNALLKDTNRSTAVLSFSVAAISYPPGPEAWAAMSLARDGPNHQEPVAAENIEVLDDLPRTNEVELRRMLEPLHGLATNLLADGAFKSDPIIERKTKQDVDYLGAQLYETEIGELPVRLSAELARTLIARLAPIVADDDANEAAAISQAGEGDGPYTPDHFIEQRDGIAERTDQSKSVIDMALLATAAALGVTSAVTEIYGAFRGDQPGGVLLGAAVAVVALTVAARGGRDWPGS